MATLLGLMELYATVKSNHTELSADFLLHTCLQTVIQWYAIILTLS